MFQSIDAGFRSCAEIKVRNVQIGGLPNSIEVSAAPLLLIRKSCQGISKGGWAILNKGLTCKYNPSTQIFKFNVPRYEATPNMAKKPLRHFPAGS